MRRRLTGALAVLLLALAASLVAAPQASAAPAYMTRTGAHTEWLNHYGDPALGQVKVELWIEQARNSSGVVVGTQQYAKATDWQGGVQALDLRYVEHSPFDQPGFTGQRNSVGQYKQTPGTQVYVHAWSSQSSCCYFAKVVGDPNAVGAITGYATIAVRWADGVLGVYDVSGNVGIWYRCYGAQTLYNCGSHYV